MGRKNMIEEEYDDRWENIVNWRRWQISKMRDESEAKLYHNCKGRIYYKSCTGWHGLGMSDICSSCSCEPPKQLMLMLKIVNSSCNED